MVALVLKSFQEDNKMVFVSLRSFMMFGFLYIAVKLV